MRKKSLLLLGLLILCFVVAVFGSCGALDGANALTESSESQDWYLQLVNADTPLPDDWTVDELTELKNGEQVDSRIYPMLQQMFDDMREQGVYPLVNEGYRSHARQEEILQQRIDEYVAAGETEAQARQKALQQVALPGTSEHELGLAVDIIADQTVCDNETVYDWLAHNAYKYGFILRYPADKTELTGIEYEPWHYRYVGKEAAEEIQERGVCLEEYLESL